MLFGLTLWNRASNGVGSTKYRLLKFSQNWITRASMSKPISSPFSFLYSKRNINQFGVPIPSILLKFLSLVLLKQEPTPKPAVEFKSETHSDTPYKKSVLLLFNPRYFTLTKKIQLLVYFY